MKTAFVAAAAALLMSGAVHADQITDAQIQNLENEAQAASDRADVASAQGDNVNAAKWREQQHYFEQQAESLRTQEQNLQNAANQISGIIQGQGGQ